jgi:hypothetical protein
MGLLEEMQVLVGGLEAAFSRRVEDERERLATAGQDARERIADIAVLRADVAGMLGEFRRERFTQGVADARERAGAERERLATAGRDARERTAEVFELGRIWSDHSVALVGLRGSVFSPPRPAVVRRRPAAPAAGRPRLATSAPAAAKRRLAEPVLAEPVTTEPAPAEPVLAEPVLAEPVLAEPVMAEPVMAEPVMAEPAPAEPVTAAAIMGYLADRPDGVKLGELETHFGGRRNGLRPILDEMITDKKVRKDAELKLFFAA